MNIRFHEQWVSNFGFPRERPQKDLRRTLDISASVPVGAQGSNFLGLDFRCCLHSTGSSQPVDGQGHSGQPSERLCNAENHAVPCRHRGCNPCIGHSVVLPKTMGDSGLKADGIFPA